MEFRILGPLEIVDDGRMLALRGTKRRALLTILLLHSNEVVSRERLIEDLWGADRPETAATALHGYISQLRKLVEPDADGHHRLLVTRAPGYELRLDPGALDLKRFEHLVREGNEALTAGDPVPASAALEEALALWRGRPLAEFGDAPFAHAEILRLEELRLSALENRIEVDLELGRHGAVIAELEALVVEYPQRERLAACLMLALYRSGRQAEALEVYQRTRRALVDELGIEPGTMLQQFERAILNHDPSLERPVERRSAPPLPDSVGDGSRTPRQLRLWPLVAATVLCLLAVALGVAFVLGGGEPAPTLLAPNTVGFIDAASGRVTKSFPVGREPSALSVANGSVWVANFRDQTVSRIDPESGDTATIPVGGHPTGIAAHGGKVWVWTIEELLVPIDPRFDTAEKAVALALGGRPRLVRTRDPGRIVAGAGFLWMTAPGTTVIRTTADDPGHRFPIVPEAGTNGPLVYGVREVWVAGAGLVFPIDAETGISRSGATVGGVVHGLAFGENTLWVVSGGPNRVDGVSPALRRIDTRTRLLETTIPVGDRPVAVAVAAGSTWVASMERAEGAIYRVDPQDNRVADTITVGSIPRAITADEDGVWAAVG